MEYYLHYIWHNKLFERLLPLDDIASLPIQVIDPGIINEDAGADFLEAKVKIGDILWVGNVEIHQKASQWYQHKHNEDKTYDNVILHIVIEDDISHDIKDDKYPLTVQMVVSDTNMQIAKQYYAKRNSLLCSDNIHSIGKDDIRMWLDKIMRKRIESKLEHIRSLLEDNANDWDEVLYQLLMQYFGFNTNNVAMTMIAKSLPYKILMKHRNNIIHLEALLIGQANILSSKNNIDEYQELLIREYYFFKQMYNLEPIDVGLIKFLRIRPQGFSYKRLAQIAAIIHNTDTLRADIIETFDIKVLRKILSQSTSKYWQNHYSLNDKKDKKRFSDGSLSPTSLDTILINVIVPYKYAYSFFMNRLEDATKSIRMLEEISFEDNKITRLFPKYVRLTNNATNSQALLHLYKNYCLTKKCIFCSWGRLMASNILRY